MAKNARKIQSFSQSLSRRCSTKEDSNSLWRYFGPNKEKQERKEARECRKRRALEEQKPDPDLTHLGGQPYRTCGTAYVVQKDLIPPSSVQKSEEDRILARIESDLSNKDNVCDPMPPFRSVEQRLIDLTERKLHPFYKRYMALPKRDFVGEEAQRAPFRLYKCKVGPVKPEEMPEILQMNKQMLERKNIFADFKRVELPKQMLARIVEMEKNRKPTLEKKEKEVQKE